MGRRSIRVSPTPEVPRICVRGGCHAGLSYWSQHRGLCSIERAGAAPLERARRKSVYIVVTLHSIWGYESYPNYLDLRDRNRSFDALAADNITQAGLDTGKNPSQAFLIEASGNYFDVLGLQPYLGRFFHAADEHGPNSAPYVVLSYAGWREHFQGDRGVVGRTVLLNKHPFVIIGVAPPGFVGTFIAFSPELFVPVNAGWRAMRLLNQRETGG